MTSINGYNGANHNVEDILASIRTSIADEGGPARMVASDVQLPVRREPQAAQEAPEFELPAIFKPGHAGAAERPKLFGRLSDALKSAAPQDQQVRSRTVIPFDPSVAGRMLEPPVQSVMSADKASRNTGTHQSQPASTQPMEEEPIARVMPTFFDTRVNRLGELTRQAYEPKKPEPQPEPAVQPAVATHQPPQLPEDGFAQHAADAVDDAAAQLLRPMLRQWLQENMPKIVEKALLSEVQGTPTKPRS